MATAHRTFGTLAAVLALGVVGWLTNRSTAPAQPMPPPVAASKATGGVQALRGGASFAPISTFYSNSFRQQVDGIGTQTVQVRNTELRPDDGTHYWTPWYKFSTPYKTRRLRGRYPDDILVVGEYDGGRVVLERWLIAPVQGAWTIDRPSQPADLGVPVDPLVPPALVAVGGVWIAPEQRTGQPRERRILVDDSLDGAPVRSLEVDPDGRFVVYVGTSPPGLYRRLLSGGATQPEELLHGEATIPEVGQIRHLHFKQHAAYGRVLVCEYGAYDYDRITILVDVDNDGLFDPPLELGNNAYVSQFEDDPTLVPDDFEEYDL
jgi:hypothetical protein